MYSVVLATMIAAGSTTPAFCHSAHHRYYASCYSSCYCCSYSCYSCYSGYSGYSGYCCSYSHCHRPLFSHHCCHTSYIYVAPSCCSVSYCCSATRVYYAPCTTCATTYSVPATTAPPTVVPVPQSSSSEVDALRREVEALRAKVKQSEGVPAPKQPQEEGNARVRNSRIVVNLPADARLFVDNVECPLQGTVRAFNTPNLDPSRVYMYTMRVELARDGQTVRDAQQITIVPGVDVQVNFNNVTQTAAR